MNQINYDPSSRFVYKNAVAIRHIVAINIKSERYSCLINSCMKAIVKNKINNNLELRNFICYKIQMLDAGINTEEFSSEDLTPLYEYVEQIKKDLDSRRITGDYDQAKPILKLAEACAVISGREDWTGTAYHEALGNLFDNRQITSLQWRTLWFRFCEIKRTCEKEFMEQL